MARGGTPSLIQVYEGEHPLTWQDNLLGRFKLKDVLPAPRGVPRLEVTFEIDANGAMKVSAADKGADLSEFITITNEKGLSGGDGSYSP